MTAAIVALFVSLFYFYSQQSPQLDTEKIPQTQMPSTETIDSSSSLDNQQNNREQNKKSNQTKSSFQLFKLKKEELDSFYQRRFEKPSFTLSIAGLQIDANEFDINSPIELPEKVTVPLPEGGSKEFLRTRVDYNNKNSFVWVGKNSDLTEHIHLSYHNSVFVGYFATTNANYEIKYLNGDKHIVRKVDTAQFPENKNDGVKESNPLSENRKDASEASEAQISQKALVGNIFLDLLIGYSYLIKQSEGSPSAALALLKLSVASANTSYQNSKTGVIIRATKFVEVTIKASNSQTNELGRLRDADGITSQSNNYIAKNPYHILANERQKNKADVISLFTEKSTPKECGRGYVLDKYQTSTRARRIAINTVAANCAPNVLAHEIGHNLGAQHNKENASSSIKTHPYAHGFRSTSKKFRTIMGLNCPQSQCSNRILYFSNPNIEREGVAIGKTNSMDNARSIRERARVISNIFPGSTFKNVDNPVITQQPHSGSVKDGGTLALTVKATSTSPISYRWYKNGFYLQGENSATLLVKASAPANIFNSNKPQTYYVDVFTEGGIVRSDKAEVQFLKKPKILSQPKDLNLDFGQPAHFSVNTSGSPAPQLQWYKQGEPLPGKNDHRLVLGPTQWFDRGSYYVKVKNSEGSVTSQDVILSLQSENKWEFLREGRGPASIDEIGKIDRDAGVQP